MSALPGLDALAGGGGGGFPSGSDSGSATSGNVNIGGLVVGRGAGGGNQWLIIGGIVAVVILGAVLLRGRG